MSLAVGEGRSEVKEARLTAHAPSVEPPRLTSAFFLVSTGGWGAGMTTTTVSVCNQYQFLFSSLMYLFIFICVCVRTRTSARVRVPQGEKKIQLLVLPLPSPLLDGLASSGMSTQDIPKEA